MKVTYTGKQGELNPAQQKKLDAKFAKIGKMLDRRTGEKEAHVILTSTRHLYKAEITAHFYDATLVGVGSDADLFTALTSAVDKLEKQIIKYRAKWRDTKRGPKNSIGKQSASTITATPVEAEDSKETRVHRVNHQSKRKPMTLDEAVLALDAKQPYLVYRDAETDRVTVLLRRSDGHLDLIES
jgi:putative sigma-54 modulation protein